MFRSALFRRCVAVLVALTLVAACDRPKSAATQPSSANAAAGVKTKASIGLQASITSALILVAKDAGIFDKHGLDVEIKEFSAGKLALQAFWGKSTNVVMSGEVPVGLATLAGNRAAVLAQVVEKTKNEVRLVARREGDVSTPAAYFSKKRRLATSIGGGPEFWVYDFLRRNNIPAQNVEIIAQRPEDMPAALASGSVDAVAVFDPYVYFAERLLGDKAVTFTIPPDGYQQLYVLSVSPEDAADRPEFCQALIDALVDAEAYVAAHPAETKATIIKYTKLEPDVVDAIYPNFTFRLALTPQLYDYWKQQAAWAVDTKKVPPGTPTPDFNALVRPQFLDHARRAAK